MKVESVCRVLSGSMLLLFCCGIGSGQCAVDLSGVRPDASQIQQDFDKQDWAEVVRLAEGLSVRPADVNFAYGLALAHLQQWPQARAALLAGEQECPRQKRFHLELAGVAFEEKHYPEAARWLRGALKLDSRDAYANDFAGTVYLLMGNMNAALKYWNRVQKPSIAAMDFDSNLKVQRLILDRAYAFSPAAVMRERELETTQARLDGLGIFPKYNIELKASADGRFDAEFHALERDGFGSGWAEALVSTFGGAAYGTLYPSYFNVGGRAMNFESLVRWDAQKRRLWASVSAPLNDRPEFGWQLDVDARNENWAIRRSFTGTAPVLGSLNLERQAVAGSLSGIPSGRLRWSTGAELSHRGYRDVVDGTALTPALTVAGYELKSLASVDGAIVEVPERRFWLRGTASQELARMWQTGAETPGAPQVFEKLQGSAAAHWFPQAQGDTYEVTGQARAGWTFGNTPFDELFLLGMERDTNLSLRGQVGTRDGKKGSSPIGSRYLLVNTDVYRRIYGNGLFELRAGPLADIARVGGGTSRLASQQWLFDVGIAARLTVFGASVVLSYGHDLRSGSNAFFGSEMRQGAPGKEN